MMSFFKRNEGKNENSKNFIQSSQNRTNKYMKIEVYRLVNCIREKNH